jgi:hypothetical protein
MTTPDPSTTLSSTHSAPQPGRPPVLGPDERRRLVDLVASGLSRRVAARQVGCAPSTITRTAARDPAFAAELVQAESSLETKLLACVRKAAENDRHWRAAAWLLERRNIHDYARRSANLFTADQMIQLFAATLDSLREKLSEAQRDFAIQQLGALLLEFDPDTPHPDGRSHI